MDYKKILKNKIFKICFLCCLVSFLIYDYHKDNKIEDELLKYSETTTNINDILQNTKNITYIGIPEIKMSPPFIEGEKETPLSITIKDDSENIIISDIFANEEIKICSMKFINKCKENKYKLKLVGTFSQNYGGMWNIIDPSSPFSCEIVPFESNSGMFTN